MGDEPQLSWPSRTPEQDIQPCHEIVSCLPGHGRRDGFADTPQLTCKFFMGPEDSEGKQIGVDGVYVLSALKKGKRTFKGMPVIGGKIDLFLKAVDFGEEEESGSDSDAFDML